MLTCPCHLPILTALLGGTIVGAFFFEHRGLRYSRSSTYPLCHCARRSECSRMMRRAGLPKRPDVSRTEHPGQVPQGLCR